MTPQCVPLLPLLLSLAKHKQLFCLDKDLFGCNLPTFASLQEVLSLWDNLGQASHQSRVSNREFEFEQDLLAKHSYAHFQKQKKVAIVRLAEAIQSSWCSTTDLQSSSVVNYCLQIVAMVTTGNLNLMLDAD